jgi:hypothetical protein
MTTIVDRTIAAINQRLASAQRQQQALILPRAPGQLHIFQFDLPHSVNDPSPWGRPMSVVVRLDGSGQVLDLERADTDLNAAVRLLRQRAGTANQQGSSQAGPSGSRGG